VDQCRLPGELRKREDKRLPAPASKMTDAVEKGFFSSERARLIQDQAPVRNVDSKKPLFSIRLLHFPIPQLPRGDFFDSIDPERS
jgi:hypothetical protein